MNPRKPQRSVTQPYYYIGPKVSFRKTPEGRLIRVQGYPRVATSRHHHGLPGVT